MRTSARSLVPLDLACTRTRTERERERERERSQVFFLSQNDSGSGPPLGPRSRSSRAVRSSRASSARQTSCVSLSTVGEHGSWASGTRARALLRVWQKSPQPSRARERERERERESVEENCVCVCVSTTTRRKATARQPSANRAARFVARKARSPPWRVTIYLTILCEGYRSPLRELTRALWP